ncbi:MAG: hypothetical protein ABJM29_12385 [Rhizobiaceae bacterium]
MGDLDAQLLLAHERRDHAALVALYAQAADQREAANDIEATCFFLTQAFIFALECGDPQVEILNRRLVAYGREEPL